MSNSAHCSGCYSCHLIIFTDWAAASHWGSAASDWRFPQPPSALGRIGASIIRRCLTPWNRLASRRTRCKRSGRQLPRPTAAETSHKSPSLKRLRERQSATQTSQLIIHVSAHPAVRGPWLLVQEEKIFCGSRRMRGSRFRLPLTHLPKEMGCLTTMKTFRSSTMKPNRRGEQLLHCTTEITEMKILGDNITLIG